LNHSILGRGRTAVQNLQAEQGVGDNELRFHQLDISNEASVMALKESLVNDYNGMQWPIQRSFPKSTYANDVCSILVCLGIDVLINNAAIAYKGDAFNEEVARNTIGINFFGSLTVCNHVCQLYSSFFYSQKLCLNKLYI
jgi:NAD(P)-dependent dehydrogenase (short-subunit alcohol dehydrogenase family)